MSNTSSGAADPRPTIPTLILLTAPTHAPLAPVANGADAPDLLDVTDDERIARAIAAARMRSSLALAAQEHYVCHWHTSEELRAAWRVGRMYAHITTERDPLGHPLVSLTIERALGEAERRRVWLAQEVMASPALVNVMATALDRALLDDLPTLARRLGVGGGVATLLLLATNADPADPTRRYRLLVARRVTRFPPDQRDRSDRSDQRDQRVVSGGAEQLVESPSGALRATAAPRRHRWGRTPWRHALGALMCCWFVSLLGQRLT